MVRYAFRRHSGEFKLQVCSDVRSGVIGRNEALRKYDLSPNLLGAWLNRYDRGESLMASDAPSTIAEYEAKIAALERKIGQLAMEIDLLKKSKQQRAASSNDEPSVISGPKAAPSDGGAM
jgi:transposase